MKAPERGADEVLVTFHGPAHRLIVGAVTIERGESARVPRDAAERLRAWQCVDVVIERDAG